MKKSIAFATLLALGTIAWSCQTGPSQAEKDYEKVSMQMDSIRNLNAELKSEQQELMDNHNRLLTQMEGMENPDSSWLETMARHEVIYEEQEATFRKIDELMNAYSEFDTRHQAGDMAEAEVEGQVDQMKEEQEEILNEQEKIENQLESMRNDHERAMDAMNNGDRTSDMDGMDQTRSGEYTDNPNE